MNYGELKSLIADYSHRDDLTSQIDGFVDRAALKIGRDANLFEQETSFDLTVTQVENDLPSDFLTVVDLYLVVNGRNQTLRQYTHSQLNALFSDQTHQPVGYAIVKQKLLIRPVNGTHTGELIYTQRLPALVSDTDTNDILTNWETVYLYGSLVEVALFTQDDSLLSQFKPLFDEEISKLSQFARFQKYGPSPAVRCG